MSVAVTVFRCLLTLGMLAGVYSETGAWTTATVGALAAANELHLWASR